MIEMTKHVIVEDALEEPEPCSPKILTAAESWQGFDEAARYYLKMSGADFIRAWDAGQFDGEHDHANVTHVLLLRPLGR
jgi:hypothetical protein